MNLSFELRHFRGMPYRSEEGSDRSWGSEGYGRSIAGMSFGAEGASGRYGAPLSRSESFTPNGDGTFSVTYSNPDSYNSFQAGYGNITGLEGTGAGNTAADSNNAQGTRNDAFGNPTDERYDVSRVGDVYTDNLTGKTLDTRLSDGDEAKAYGLTGGQLLNARNFEGLGGEVKDGVYPANKPYMDAKTGKLVDSGGIAKNEGYGMRAGDLVQRNAFGAAGVNFLGDYGKIAMAISPMMTMGFMGLDKAGAFDKTYGAPAQQGQSAGQGSYGSHGNGGGGSADPTFGMPTEGLGLSKAPDAAATEKSAKSTLMADWFKSNPNASDIRIRQAQDKNGWASADVAAAAKIDPSMWSARYNAATPYMQFSSMIDNALADRMNDDPSAARTEFVLGNRTTRRA